MTRVRYKGSIRQVRNIRVRLALEREINEIMVRFQFAINSGCDRKEFMRAVKWYLQTGEKRLLPRMVLNIEAIDSFLVEARRRFVRLKDKIRGEAAV